MTRRKSLRGFAAVLLAAGFVLVAGSAAFAQYPTTPTTTGGCVPTITGPNESVTGGQSVPVSGTCCAPGQSVSFILNPGGMTIGQTTADSSGNYTGTVTIPENLGEGQYTIAADCGGQTSTEVLGLSVGAGGTGTTTGSTTGSTGTALPRTGSNLAPLVGLGGAAIVLGAAAVYGTRRRRRLV
jgi:LPXTG-motif cell wall-anchored protein